MPFCLRHLLQTEKGWKVRVWILDSIIIQGSSVFKDAFQNQFMNKILSLPAPSVFSLDDTMKTD